MNEIVTCKNCGHRFEGNFCNRCGQAANIPPIDIRFIWHDLQHGLFHYNNKVFFTIRELFTRPGYSIREFIQGKRLKHFLPISFVIVLAGIYGAVFHALGIDILARIHSTDPTKSEAELITEWLVRHYAITQLLCIPVFTATSYLSFRKWGGTFLEYIVINAFLTVQRLMLGIAFLPALYHYSGTPKTVWVTDTTALISAILACWTFIQYFNDRPKKQVILRTLLAYLYAILGIAILFTLAITVYFAVKEY